MGSGGKSGGWLDGLDCLDGVGAAFGFVADGEGEGEGESGFLSVGGSVEFDAVGGGIEFGEGDGDVAEFGEGDGHDGLVAFFEE